MYADAKAMKDPGGYLRPEAVDSIVEAGANERDRLLLMTMAQTGRRVSEIVGPLGIKPSDIDTETSTIAFTVLKKKKDLSEDRPRRRKYVPSSLCFALDSYSQRLNIGRESPIFGMTRQHAFAIVRRAALKAGVFTVSGRKVHPHHFRHTFVTSRVLSGLKWEDALQLKDYMEHSNIGVTESYTHIDPKGQKKLFKEDNEDKEDE